MTKEEIIEAIQDDKMMPFIQPEQLAEIVNFVIKNYKTSLPSNLDEVAEKAALKAYPEKDALNKKATGHYDPNYPRRKAYQQGYQQGYEQAEKDLALTWQDVAILITIYEQEVEAGNISRYEDEGAPSLKEASEIILRRFNELVKQLKQEQL